MSGASEMPHSPESRSESETDVGVAVGREEILNYEGWTSIDFNPAQNSPPGEAKSEDAEEDEGCQGDPPAACGGGPLGGLGLEADL